MTGDPRESATTPPRLSLIELNREIEARARATRAAHPDWPCGRGCDACCRRLAEVPILTQAEWDLLREGLDTLPAAERQARGRAIAALADAPPRPILCPLLDPASGACRVYPYRPVACRTYGFYVQQGQGLHCREIERRVAAGEWPDTLWGNHDAVDRRLDRLGERRTLPEWLGADDRTGCPPFAFRAPG